MRNFDAQVAALARRQHGLFSRAQAAVLGASESSIARRVKAGVWVPVAPGVLRLAGVPDNLETRSRAVALAVPGAVLTGPSAAAVLGRGPWDDVPLGRRPWLMGSRRPGFQARWLTHPGGKRQMISGVLVAKPGTAVVDLLRFLPPDHARTVAYRALQTNVVTLSELAAAARRLVRHAGAPQLRMILADISSGAHAESERLLISLLTAGGFSGWYANHRIDLPDRTVFADAAFPAHHLVIEIDGRAWHTTPNRFQVDRTRQNALVRAGWTVLRFTWDDLDLRPDRVVAEVRDTLARRESL